ncbi:hypothetical protein GOP47_0023898 [Adiantum capillus-veneris]|uniref:Uncharacterized protein n=1 Tax=Adiantum capillus-veneris TaxID=13818 RepID=A0A9D4U4K4_ADICA|nr:hypothetical protein GOP47_0023898 [Adiantum capillus-veneris]
MDDSIHYWNLCETEKLNVPSISPSMPDVSSVPSMLKLVCALSALSSSRLSFVPIPTVSPVRSEPLPLCGSCPASSLAPTVVEKKFKSNVATRNMQHRSWPCSALAYAPALDEPCLDFAAPIPCRWCRHGTRTMDLSQHWSVPLSSNAHQAL